MTQNAKEYGCATCGMRAKAETNPRGIMSRLWKWHTNWCPGWKAYQKALAEGDPNAVAAEEARNSQ